MKPSTALREEGSAEVPGAEDNAPKNDYNDGVQRTYQTPGYRFPGGTGANPDTERVRKVTCAAVPLNHLWYNDRKESGFWGSYYGDQTTGLTAHVPAPWSCNPDYDPRMRPWYSSAATGPKDLERFPLQIAS